MSPRHCWVAPAWRCGAGADGQPPLCYLTARLAAVQQTKRRFRVGRKRGVSSRPWQAGARPAPFRPTGKSSERSSWHLLGHGSGSAAVLAAGTSQGIGWVTGFTIASEIGDISRFSSPVKLTGYTGLCPRVSQSGEVDRRGPISKHGPRYLRWGLMEAAIHASAHPLYKERYQRTKRRLGRQRGAKVAQIELARKLSEAIWYMLTRNQPFKPFAPEGAISRLTA